MSPLLNSTSRSQTPAPLVSAPEPTGATGSVVGKNSEVARSSRRREASTSARMVQELNLVIRTNRPNASHHTLQDFLWTPPARRHLAYAVGTALSQNFQTVFLQGALLATTPVIGFANLLGVAALYALTPLVTARQSSAKDEWEAYQVHTNSVDLIQNTQDRASLRASQDAVRGLNARLVEQIPSLTGSLVERAASLESFIVSTSISLLVLGFSTSGSLVLSLLAGGVLTLGSAWRNRSWGVPQLETMRQARAELVEHSGSMGEHNVLGNRAEKTRWFTVWTNKFQGSVRAQRVYNCSAMWDSTLRGYLAGAPVMGQLLYSALRPGADGALTVNLAVLVGTVPAAMATAQSFQTLGNYLVGFPLMKSDRNALNQVVRVTDETQPN